MDYPIRFPDQIRQQRRALRKTKGLTQTQLGKLLTALDAHIAQRLVSDFPRILWERISNGMRSQADAFKKEALS